MGDMTRKSWAIQQLSPFALSDSVRENVSKSLRKRRKPSDGEENVTQEGELRHESSCGHSGFRSVALMLRSARCKNRSEKVMAGSQDVNCEDENEIRKDEVRRESSSRNTSSRAVVVKGRSTRVVVKGRSTRAERSDEVGTKPGTSSQAPSTIVGWDVARKSGLEDANQGDYQILDKSFYECDALELAPKLLSKLIRRDDVVLQITEVEAYRPGDSACHGQVGETERTAPLFGPAGHAYVYLCYGLHIMLNVMADGIGVGAAVLIRACFPVTGLSSIQLRRGQVTMKSVLLTGPGKLFDRNMPADPNDVDCEERWGGL